MVTKNKTPHPGGNRGGQVDNEFFDVNEFFAGKYEALSRYCHSRWNGQGGDVLHTAWEIAAERYMEINFSLFSRLVREAARNLKIRRWQHENGEVIILPPTRRAARRLDLERATPVDEVVERTREEIKLARALLRAEKKGQLSFWSSTEGVR